MEQERDEVYERIPWETLEKRDGDRQWLVYAVAGAVVLGALAYSFMRNQPPSPPPEAFATTTVAPTVTTVAPTTPSTVTSPIVVSEADLYAVDPDLLAARAASHAEWFAVEFVAFDGSERSAETVAALLPGGLPAPTAPHGTQVFVDWAGVRSVTQTSPATFEVEVLVRSLVSNGDPGFVRQPPLVVLVEVTLGDDGEPRISGAPLVATVDPGSPAQLSLKPLPEPLAAQLDTAGGEILGGIVREDGTWEVVVVAEGPDGVRRPVTILP
jgi:hypothetical protein